MLALSWIITVLAYGCGGAFLAIGLIDPGILGQTITLFDCIILAVVGFVGLGFVAHLCATKAIYNNRNGGSLAVWIISFLPYILPSVALFLLVQILRVIDYFVYVISDKHIVAQFVNTVTDALFSKQFAVFAGAGTLNDSEPVVTETYYEVDTSFGKRKLKYFDNREDNDTDSPYYMKRYNLFRDDIGHFGRSYDGNVTFIEEKLGKI